MMGVYIPASELFGMLKAAEGRKLLKTDYLILEDYTLECSEKV
jgi:hypothetical protein